MLSIYVTKDRVAVPTRVKTKSGLGLLLDPVKVIPASDVDSIAQILKERLLKGETIVDNPSPEELKKITSSKVSFVGKALGYSSGLKFHRESRCVAISKEGDGFDVYLMQKDGRGYMKPDEGIFVYRGDGALVSAVNKAAELVTETSRRFCA